jgi:hypothetical protein
MVPEDEFHEEEIVAPEEGAEGLPGESDETPGSEAAGDVSDPPAEETPEQRIDRLEKRLEASERQNESLSKRIGKVVAKKHNYREQVEALQAELEKREKFSPVNKSLGDFGGDVEKYTDHLVEQKLAAARIAEETAGLKSQIHKTMDNGVFDDFNNRLLETFDGDQETIKLIAGSGVVYTPDVAQYLTHHPLGPQIVKSLSSDPAYAKAIMSAPAQHKAGLIEGVAMRLPAQKPSAPAAPRQQPIGSATPVVKATPRSSQLTTSNAKTAEEYVEAYRKERKTRINR